MNGYATVYRNQTLIAVGDGPIRCGTETSASPPTGTNAIFFLPVQLTQQAYTSVGTQLIQTSATNFDSVSTTTGSVTLTKVAADSLAGSVSFDYTDAQTQDHYAISGTFEVTRCGP